jgi:chondroitin AC lyase
MALRKTWFFHGDIMLCLLADQEQRSAKTGVVTSMEQCRLQGSVTVSAFKSESRVLPEGEHALKHTRWVLHNKVGYLPIEPSAINLYLGEARGSWSAINSRYQDEPNSVTDRVFRIELPHADRCPSGFVVVLNADAKKLDHIYSGPEWQVLRNDADCQAIQFANGPTMATFYKSGSIDAAPEFSVDTSCLLMARGDEVWLCDPTSQGKELAIARGKHKQKVELPAGGTAAKL